MHSEQPFNKKIMIQVVGRNTETYEVGMLTVNLTVAPAHPPSHTPSHFVRIKVNHLGKPQKKFLH